MSEVKVNKISPRTNCGTVQLGDSGDTITIPAGATITNNGTQTGFGRTGAVDWQTGSIKTATFTATNGEGYFCNTSGGAFTLTLPASPSAGDIIAVADYTRTFNSNNLTIGRNSQPIGGVAEDAILSVNGQSATFVYVDGTEGWINVQETETSQTGIPPAYITATGGTITTVCTNYKVHTFTGPGTFTITAGSGPLSKLDYYVVAGGGGGGGGETGYWTGGGGGAGGFRESKTASVSGCWSASPLVAACGSLGPFSSPTAIPVTVGSGGSAGTTGSPGCNSTAGGSGSPSVFSTITSAGGGGGGASTGDTSGTKPQRFGIPGGSGGGSGGGGTNPIGNGNTPPVSPPQGNNGGQGSVPSTGRGGGGGGAGAVGGTYPCMSGGTGIASSITGSPVGRAGGGNGSGSGGAGPANSGDGGDSNPCGGNGAAGGSGVVIVRYRFQ